MSLEHIVELVETELKKERELICKQMKPCHFSANPSKEGKREAELMPS